MQDLLSQMPPANGRNIIEKIWAENKDIRNIIEKNLNLAASQVKNIATQFEGNDRTETCRNIWNYLKKNVRYRKDQDLFQDVRLPSRLIKDRREGADCKSFSLFFASVLKCLGYPVTFRYTSYDPNNSTPSHIYVVTQDEDGREIICDATYTDFNREAKYYYKIDNQMNVRTLSGPIDSPLNGKVKDFFNKVGKAVKKVVKTGTLAPSRGAFLGLIKINFRGFANRFIKLGETRTKAFWDKWGGQYSHLRDAINTGKGKKPLMIKASKLNAKVASINGHISEPTTTIALIAAASAVLVAAINTFKKAGIQDPTDSETVSDAILDASVFPDVLQPDPSTDDIPDNTSGGGNGGGGIATEDLIKYGLIGGAAYLVLKNV